MKFGEKLDILIRRNGYKKTEFADKLGITYRAIANYTSGARYPRNEVMKKIETLLGTSREFLLDDKQNLILESEERFLYYASNKSIGLNEALSFLQTARGIFNGDSLVSEDKQVLFSLLTEVYFDAKAKNN